MFEYHGWISLRSTAEAVDDEPDLRLDEIKALVAEHAGHALMDLRWLNGDPYIHVAGNPNHRGAHGSAIIELFAKVGELAPGSYGLLHVWDDEADLWPDRTPTAYEDKAWDRDSFQVFRLVRGKLTMHVDTLLSPVIPTIEDEWVFETERTGQPGPADA